jgi:hypothetical protein
MWRPRTLLVLCFVLVPACSARGPGSGAARPFDADLRCTALPDSANSTGRRNKNTINDKIREHHSALEQCYEGALQRNSAARGRIVTRLVIAEDGAVSAACVQRATLEDGEAVECMLEELRSVRFGNADGTVTVLYPIGFDSGR